jgi:predicted DNA-binding transcriptional regulator AlpA
MTNITFDQLPQAVTDIFNKVENIERLLLDRSTEPQPEADRWFDLVELCNYLPDKPSVATVYGWVHFNTVPYHKGQKKLRFLKSEIDAWLLQGRIRTKAETAAAAEIYIRRR